MTMNEVIRYPKEPPGPGREWVYDSDSGKWIEKAVKGVVPQSELLGDLTTVDAYGLTSYFGYLDAEGKKHITKIERTPPPKGFRMVYVEGPIDPSMGQGAGFWSMEPDLPPDTSLQVELDKALRSGNTKRIAELQAAISTYQEIMNAYTPYEQNQIDRQKRVDAAAAQQAKDEQKRWELSQASTDAERRAIEERFNTDQLRLKAAENRRQLEWSADFGATQEERAAAHQRWETEFGNGQYEFGATLGQRQLEFGTEMAQRQWESGQTAQREALKLGLQIQQSPGDWWALENLRYGAQPNRPYTGADVAPRTWVDPWMQFANQPMPKIPQPTTPSQGPPALSARPERLLPPVAPAPAATGVTPADVAVQVQGANQAPAVPALGGPPVPTVSPEDEEGPGFFEPPVPRRITPPQNTFGTPSVAPAPATNTRIEMQNEEGTTVFALPEEEEALTGEGFIKKKSGTLLDWALPWLNGASNASPSSRLPRLGVRQALYGQPVSRPRQWSTLGASVTPSAQSWAALPWEGKQIFQSEQERIGVPWESYAQEMASLWPSWGTPGRFRRAPTTMGFTGG